jgi:hypothetical protein
MAKLIGNAPNQVPTNADLGSMAFEDRTNYITKNNPVHQPFRNIIINGDMSIAQRSTSVASISSGVVYHTVDRWITSASSAGTWTQSQSTDVPSGQGFAKSLKIDCTTANASLSASSELLFQSRFEGQNLQYLKKGTANAQSLTLSFWVKSTKTGTFIAELFDSDNTRQISKSYTIDSASTWEKKTLTFSGDTTGAFGNDNATSLSLNFWLSAGSNYTSGTLNTSWNANTNANRVVGQVNLADSTSNDFWITGVQLEAGTTASDFEFLPYDVNLQRCLRYYEKSVNYIASKVSSNTIPRFEIYESVYYQVQKRAAPTVTITGFSGGTNQVSRADTGADLGANSGRLYTNGINFFNLDNNNSSSPITTNYTAVTYTFKSDAEL